MTYIDDNIAFVSSCFNFDVIVSELFTGFRFPSSIFSCVLSFTNTWCIANTKTSMLLITKMFLRRQNLIIFHECDLIGGQIVSMVFSDAFFSTREHTIFPANVALTSMLLVSFEAEWS